MRDNEKVYPQTNLPSEAMPWGREVTKDLLGTQKGLERLGLNLEMSNRATAGQMGVLGRQLDQLYLQSEELRIQNDFLVNQNGGASLAGVAVAEKTPAQTFTTEVQPFDPLVDPEISFITGPSGRFMTQATVSATTYSKSTAASYVRCSVGLRVAVYFEGERVGAGARLSAGSLAESGAIVENNSTLSGFLVFSGQPNKEYTLRAERRFWGDAGVPGTAGTRQHVSWGEISISYMNLWN